MNKETYPSENQNITIPPDTDANQNGKDVTKEKQNGEPKENKGGGSFSIKIINTAKEVFKFFMDMDETEFAIRAGTCHAIPIDSKKFKNEITELALEKHGRIPNSDHINEAKRYFCAIARKDQREVFTRYAVQNNCINIDVCDQKGTVLELNHKGIEPASQPPIFIRPSGIHPLPDPHNEGDINILNKYINTKSKKDFWLIVSWLITVMRPDIGCPILIFQGEQGTGKTTVSKMLRALCDPRSAPISTHPRNPEDVFVNARNWRVLAFDNLSGIGRQISDSLCAITTGTGWSGRELFTTADELNFSVQRAIMANGIDDIATRGDVQDRSVIINLPIINKKDRLPEKTLWELFDQDKGKIFSALLQAIQYGLNNPVELSSPPRMADYANWSASCLAYFGISKEVFQEYLKRNEAEITDAAIDSNPTIQAILEIIKDGDYKGTAGNLCGKIKEKSNDVDKRSLPNVNNLHNKLKRAAPILRKQGIYWKRSKSSGKRLIEIYKQAPE